MLISLVQDVFRSKQEFLNGSHHPAFEQHRFPGQANFLQKRIILHVSRAYLQHVSIS
jgi:hypothetical protein